MLNILKTEPCAPCHATVGSFFFSLFINFSLQAGFFESGRQHSVDPVGEPRRNVKMEEMGAGCTLASLSFLGASLIAAFLTL